MLDVVLSFTSGALLNNSQLLDIASLSISEKGVVDRKDSVSKDPIGFLLADVGLYSMYEYSIDSLAIKRCESSLMDGVLAKIDKNTKEEEVSKGGKDVDIGIVTPPPAVLDF